MKKIFMYGVLTAAAVAVSAMFLSCTNNLASDALMPLSLADIYGYRYRASFTSSSGTQLTPELVIYNDNRLDWNMSTTGMTNNKYMYRAEKTGANSYVSYWYGNATDWENNDKSKASMTVELGLNSMDEVVVLTSNAKDGAGSQMQGTRVSMHRNGGRHAGTVPTISDITDTAITIPSDASLANWNGNSEYTGTFIYLVAGAGNDGITGDGSTPTVKIDGNTVNKVKVTTPKMLGMGYNIQFEVADVEVKSANGITYLDKTSFTAKTLDNTYEIKNGSLTGKLENGVLTLRVVFKPGNMPLDIIQVFKSAS